jgi:hypothetical protein
MNAPEGTQGTQGTIAVLQPKKSVDFKPKRSCNKCHGTGRLGFLNGDKKQPVPCGCIRKQVRAMEAKKEIDKDTRINVVPVGAAGPAGDTTERK